MSPFMYSSRRMRVTRFSITKLVPKFDFSVIQARFHFVLQSSFYLLCALNHLVHPGFWIPCFLPVFKKTANLFYSSFVMVRQFDGSISLTALSLSKGAKSKDKLTTSQSLVMLLFSILLSFNYFVDNPTERM